METKFVMLKTGYILQPSKQFFYEQIRMFVQDAEFCNTTLVDALGNTIATRIGFTTITLPIDKVDTATDKMIRAAAKEIGWTIILVDTPNVPNQQKDAQHEAAPVEEKCGNCKHWNNEELLSKHEGICKATPPTYISNARLGVWPLTKNTSRCGQFCKGEQQ
jgi:hypothetical protein